MAYYRPGSIGQVGYGAYGGGMNQSDYARQMFLQTYGPTSYQHEFGGGAPSGSPTTVSQLISQLFPGQKATATQAASGGGGYTSPINWGAYSTGRLSATNPTYTPGATGGGHYTMEANAPGSARYRPGIDPAPGATGGATTTVNPNVQPRVGETAADFAARGGRTANPLIARYDPNNPGQGAALVAARQQPAGYPNVQLGGQQVPTTGISAGPAVYQPGGGGASTSTPVGSNMDIGALEQLYRSGKLDQTSLALISAGLGQAGQNQAFQENQNRYNQILGGYQGLYGDLTNQGAGIVGGYQNRYDTGMGIVNQMGAGERSQIEQNRAAGIGQADAAAANRGFYNSTVATGNQALANRDAQQQLLNLNDRLLAQQLSEHNQLSGDTLGYQERLSNQLTGAGQNQLNFMERRTDQYPDNSSMMNLLSQLAQANALRGGGYGGGYTAGASWNGQQLGGVPQYAMPYFSYGGGGGGYSGGGGYTGPTTAEIKANYDAATAAKRQANLNRVTIATGVDTPWDLGWAAGLV
jgi:hypothetical protein